VHGSAYIYVLFTPIQAVVLKVMKPCAAAGCAVLVPVGTSRCAAHAARDKRDSRKRADANRAGKPSRRWYRWARWKRRRLDQLTREPLCCYCEREGRTTLAEVADHIKPHREDYDRFWFGALQSLCWSCHSGTKQREEARAEQPDVGFTLPKSGTPKT